MFSRYILVDSENIKPRVTALVSFLEDEHSQLLIFTNSQQQFPAEMSQFLQPYGRRVEYIVMSGGGKNALDFLIAFYLGKIISNNPDSEIQIISGDKGFAPLISHIKQRGSKNVELRTLDNNDTLPGKIRQRVTRICAALEKETDPWPSSHTTIADFIRTALPDCELPDNHVAGLLNFMLRKELISMADDDSLNYHRVNISNAAKGAFVIKTNTGVPENQASIEPIVHSPTTMAAIGKICTLLKKKGDGRPKKFQTLLNTVKTHLAINDERDVEDLLILIEKKGIFTRQTGTSKVAYCAKKIEAEVKV